MKEEPFYTEEKRKRMLEEIENPINKMQGVSESTALEILDGIYSIRNDLQAISKKMEFVNNTVNITSSISADELSRKV